MQTGKTFEATKTTKHKKESKIYAANDEFCYKIKNTKGTQRKRQNIRLSKRA
jgi:hypothetical protein